VLDDLRWRKYHRAGANLIRQTQVDWTLVTEREQERVQQALRTEQQLAGYLHWWRYRQQDAMEQTKWKLEKRQEQETE